MEVNKFYDYIYNCDADVHEVETHLSDEGILIVHFTGIIPNPDEEET
jgi:hypothetical protein